MTYCCNHTRRASELMDSAINWISGTSDYEIEPAVSFIPVFGGPTASFSNKRACEEYKEWMSSARNRIQEAQQELRNCSCKQISSSAVVVPGSFTCVVSSNTSSTAEVTGFVVKAVCDAVNENNKGYMETKVMQNEINIKYHPK